MRISLGFGKDASFEYNYRLYRYVFEKWATRARWGFGNGLHRLHTVDDLAEGAIARAGSAPPIKRVDVVAQVDEELRCRGIRLHASSHGNGASLVLDPESMTLARLILDRCAR